MIISISINGVLRNVLARFEEIYNKYYDPLIYILFLTLFHLDMDRHYFKKKYKHVQLYCLSIGYLTIAFFKNYLL